MTQPNKGLREDLVLVISAEGVHRDPLLKALRMEGLTASFVGNLSTVTDVLAEMRPGTLLHDWGAVEPSQSIAFQQRIGKVVELAGMVRIIYAESVTPQLVALSSDCGVKRVISYGSPLAGLVSEITLSLNSVRGLSDLQQTIHRAHSGERYDQASIDDNVEKAYAQYAHDPAVRLEFGNLCLRRKDLDKSRTIATELIETNPQNVRAMNLLARVMMKQGQATDAVALLEKANALSPLSTDRLLLLGDAFYKVGALDKAADCYTQVSDLDPENRHAQKGLGQVKLSEGDLNSALDLLRNSASEEEAAAIFNNAAVLATRSGKHRESLKLYEAALKALKSNALKAAVYFNTSLTLERLGRLDDALKAINRAIKYDGTYDKAIRQRRRLEEALNQRLAQKSA